MAHHAVVEILAVTPPLWPVNVQTVLEKEEMRSAFERTKVRHLVYIFSMYSDTPFTGAPAMAAEMDANIFDTQNMEAVGLLMVRTSDGCPAAEAK